MSGPLAHERDTLPTEILCAVDKNYALSVMFTDDCA